MAAKRRCIDCPALTDSTRCAACQRRHDQRRNKRRTWYAGTYDQRARNVRANAVGERCELCGELILEGQPVHADHVNPRDITSRLRPTHARCNEARGNR